MTTTNQIYNSHFLLGQENRPDFPDGWVQTGGDKATKWEWAGTPEGPRSVEIVHPTGPRAGITLGNDVIIPAGEVQRWGLRVVLQTEPAETLCYIKVYLGAVSQLLFSVRSSSEPEAFTRVFATPSGVTGLRVEVGILGIGKVIIQEIQGWRLYPERELRLDEKGQLYVRHVDSIGKIQSPVSVNVVNPNPIPVDVRTPVRAELRDIVPSRDGIKIYGSDGNPINSTEDGSVRTIMSGRKYVQSLEQISASVAGSTIPKDVSEVGVFSFAVYNMGSVGELVQLQISPDGVIWTLDDVEREVLPGDLAVIAPNYFLRYVRLVFRSQTPNSLKIWFQAQS